MHDAAKSVDSRKHDPLAVRLALPWIGAILLGTVLLRLRVASVGKPLGWIDALFTATSATCVTGLTTIDVGQRLSDFGQTVVLVLIQLGGLGITTLSTLLLVAAGRATLSQHYSAQNSLAAVRVNPLRLLWWVALSTFTLEALGAVGLYTCWGESESWWTSVFHSISAFCNAGFSLFPDSLTSYRLHPGINVIVTTLIMLGGVGFIAQYQILSWAFGTLRGRRKPLFLHGRAVLVGSAALWLIGAVMFLSVEWNNSLTELPAAGKALAAWFQSVTTRTAGFSTVDISAMREPTLFFTMFLMLIGGAPGSCAGGIKVTTVLVILATTRARVRGSEAVALFRRTVPENAVRRSFALLILSLLFLTFVTSVLLVTEERQPVSDVRTDRFLLLAFEAVSAFGTVGLSAGVTPGLSSTGRLIIIICMFVGRLGPLAVAVAVFQPRRAKLYEYPRENLAVG